MKKIAVVVSALVIMVSLPVLVFTAAPADKWLDETVYRGEKWGFDYGIPKNEKLIILPQNRKQSKAYGNGYVVRVPQETTKYNIVLLDK